jgi:type VI secretion system protein ImpH
MATDHRPASDLVELIAALQREPFRFDFFQTLRRLEAAHASKPRIGESVKAAADPVRLGQEPDTRFAPATIARLLAARGGQAPRLLVYFLGLLGANGPLPLHLTEYARDRLRNADDPTFARFLDVFNHRMLELFYRAWAQAQPTASFDRPQSDRFGVYVAALFGLGMPAFLERDAMTDLAKRHFAGHLSCQARHADGLRAILGDVLQMPVAIQELVGHWLDLPADCRWRLGESMGTGSMGLNATVGARVWDRQCKFRIRVGPVALIDYERLLPGGRSLRGLVAMVRNYVGDQFAWDLNLVLAEPEVPPLRLGAKGYLGWTTWLTSRRLGRDGDDLLLDAVARPSATASAARQGIH